MSEWKPIETAIDQSAAPWDGRPILVGRADMPIPGCDNAVLPAYVGEASWDEDRQAFCFDSVLMGITAYAAPTHWMPLPAPPVSA